MKKEVLLLILILFGIFVLPLIFAANNTQIDEAYSCLEDKIAEKTCDKLSVSENIFSVLATGECRNELEEIADSDGCWPDDDCDLKTTAQALLALGDLDAKDWLLEQNETPDEITWYLQIEPESESECAITYDNDDYYVEIGEDKKIDSSAGDCLSLSNSDYWLEIDSDCYGEEFEISCDSSFITNLLFKSDSSSTVHVSGKTSSASGGGTTYEQVNSFCFVEEDSCSYEGSLWAALALDSVGEDVSAYLPYLITMADENTGVFSEPFLYALTSYEDIKYELLQKQFSEGYWQVSTDRYYDTALALYPFAYEEFDEKTEAQDWLLDMQDDDGCWNSGNILDTAFILHSVWTREVDEVSCTDAGYYCMSSADCDDAEGTPLSGYSCSGYYICCDSPAIEETCEEAGGTICTGGKECSGDTISTADTNYCCLYECVEPGEEEFDCEIYGGVCEPYECGEGYEKSNEYTCDYNDVCCMKKKRSGPNALFWILIILVVLVVLGIIFRDKLRKFWFRLGGKSKKPEFKGREIPGPGLPMTPSTEPRRRIRPRHIMPSGHHPATKRPAQRPGKISTELDDVLKKLKDMGKK